VKGLGDVGLAAGDMTLCVGESVGIGVEVAALPHPAASMTAATITATAAAISLVFTGLIYPCAPVAELRHCTVSGGIKAWWRISGRGGSVAESHSADEKSDEEHHDADKQLIWQTP
jgi:hypothetical protein